jgi:hypothetical protein
MSCGGDELQETEHKSSCSRQTENEFHELFHFLLLFEYRYMITLCLIVMDWEYVDLRNFWAKSLTELQEKSLLRDSQKAGGFDFFTG